MNEIKLPTAIGKARHEGHEIHTIVLHAMSEYFDVNGKHMHATDFLNSQGLSCHYMVAPGGTIIECADPEHLTTWHARGHNTNSIGIEILMPGLNRYDDFQHILKSIDYISKIQSDVCALLCAKWCIRYKITLDGIKFHHDLDPDRKYDPGVMHDWDAFFSNIKHLVGEFSYVEGFN